MSEEIHDATKSRKGVKKSEALWLLSFSDMSLSLLCFFILMMSTMRPVTEKFNHVKEAMSKEKKPSTSENVKTVAAKLKKIIKEKKLEDVAEVRHDVEGLHIEFKDAMLFPSGAAHLKAGNLPTIYEVMKVIAKIDQAYQIKIEGHTDETPLIGSQLYPTNWELSAARGFSIMRQLQALGVPEERLAVIAYAHTRPKVPYAGLKGPALQKARAANRRVIIWLE